MIVRKVEVEGSHMEVTLVQDGVDTVLAFDGPIQCTVNAMTSGFCSVHVSCTPPSEIGPRRLNASPSF